MLIDPEKVNVDKLSAQNMELLGVSLLLLSALGVAHNVYCEHQNKNKINDISNIINVTSNVKVNCQVSANK